MSKVKNFMVSPARRMQRFAGAFFIALIAATSLFILPGSACAAPRIAADAAVLADLSTGQILYDKNGSKRRAPASLTKILTCIIALEYGRLQEPVEVCKQAGMTRTGSTIGLNEGDRIFLGELVKAALIFSANDSTVAIADHVAGSHTAFLELMNKKALALGAFNSRFKNTNGYSTPNHYTTARDLVIITRYALKNHIFNRLVKTKKATVRWLEPKKDKEITNTNRLLVNGEYPGIDGVKTGTSVRAGKCIIVSATNGDRRLLAVVLHSPNRYGDAVKLLDYGFKGTRAEVLCEKGEIITRVPVTEGRRPEVAAVAAERVKVYLDKENPPPVQKKIILSKERSVAPVERGDVLGKVVFFTDEGELASTRLVAGESVPRPLWPVRMLRKIS